MARISSSPLSFWTIYRSTSVLTDRFVMRVKDRTADLEANMERTLVKIKAIVEERDPQT